MAAEGAMSENPSATGLAPDGETAPAAEPAAQPAHPPVMPVPAAASGLGPRPRRGRLLPTILIVIFVLFAALGGGAYFANASFSATYSPQQAVINYLAAQQHGDVDAMFANANFTRGDGSYEQFFNKTGLTAMMALSENKEISNVKIKSNRQVDSATAIVVASMTWAGADVSIDYTVRKNLADTHFLLYNSWKVDVPNTTILFSLPNQPGPVQLDGILLPSTSATYVQAIAGYHTLSMQKSVLYDTVSQTVNGVGVPPPVTFEGKLSATAMAAAVAAVKAGSVVCNASKYDDCPNHTYHAPVKFNTIYYLTMPGYPEIDYKTYLFKYSGDLTSGMKLTVEKDGGLVYATGTCAVTMTVSGYGAHTYRFKGTWSADLTWTGSSFTATVYPNCEDKKA